MIVFGRMKKRILVVKEPSNAEHILRVRCDFGPVPVIHIVRDVRQMMLSKALETIKMSPAQRARLWFTNNTQIMKYKHYFPHYHFMRYEDLTADPEKEIRQLLKFLKLDFSEGMLEYWNHEHSDEKLALWDGKKPANSPWAVGLNRKSIAPSRVEVPSKIQELYESSPLLVKLNKHFGY